VDPDTENETVDQDKRDLAWAAVLKRTFEAYIRGERANMYGEWLRWS
jgi:WD repeat and SOF domain-containing protein 1